MTEIMLKVKKRKRAQVIVTERQPARHKGRADTETAKQRGRQRKRQTKIQIQTKKETDKEIDK
jgi:hypothetical protein